MNIHVLDWIKEDLSAEGKSLKDFTLIDLKPLLEAYKSKYNA